TFIKELRLKEGYVDVEDAEVDEWGNLEMTTLNFSTDTASTFSSCTTECLSGFYGERCDIPCNCSRPFCTKLHGVCYEADCQKGWFGEDCRTEDLAAFAYIVEPQEFFDGDSTSCRVPDNNTIYIELFENFFLTSFSLVFEEPEYLHEGDLVVSFFDRKKNDFVNRRVLVQKITPIRFKLQLTSALVRRRLFINMKKAISVCTVNIDGGVNLVQLNKSEDIVSIPGFDENDTLIESITDEDRFNTCISTNLIDRIIVKFNGMKKLYRIGIYPSRETD
ncbi:uncharacterized protein LOC131933357, partial [Physella acuta]|uniref:uncharacterized protein LOC131933357 n=1 Tax=Physella acuta TaxID=109671 RepID=UPI0027DBF81D